MAAGAGDEASPAPGDVVSAFARDWCAEEDGVELTEVMDWVGSYRVLQRCFVGSRAMAKP